MLMQVKLELNSIKCNNVFVIIKQSLYQNALRACARTHTGPPQYRQPTVNEQDHYQDSQQESDQSTNFIFNKMYVL
jgi:hypothetical protein